MCLSAIISSVHNMTRFGDAPALRALLFRIHISLSKLTVINIWRSALARSESLTSIETSTNSAHRVYLNRFSW
jgi:hypothetical protein